MPKPRGVVSEEPCRQRLWLQVKPALERTTKAGIARRWENRDGTGTRPKSALTRLENSQLPTTLGNLHSLAAALDMQLGELLWPLVNPKDPEGAAREAEDRYSKADADIFGRQLRKLKEAMESDDAQRFVRMMSRLAMVSPDELPTVIDMVEGLMLLREGESK